jgi:signal peptidase II
METCNRAPLSWQGVVYWGQEFQVAAANPGNPSRREGILVAQPPGRKALSQQATARHGTLLVMFLVSTTLCLFLDQLGKLWAFAAWREPAAIWRVIPGLYAGAKARNYGGMYSLEGSGDFFVRAGLAIVGFVAMALVFRWAIVLDRDRWCRFDAAIGGLLLAGVLSNQVDRLALGYVRDYLILEMRPKDIFNTADVFMVLGAILLMASLLIRGRSALGRA